MNHLEMCCSEMPTAALALYGTIKSDEANRENTTGKIVFKAAFTVTQKNLILF